MTSFLNDKAQPQVISLKQNNSKNNGYDFSCLKEHVNNKRVIMLGEADHGDASAFATKVALVKYLHLHCGFNVFTIEADFFTLNKAWMQATTSEEILDLAKHVYPFWSKEKSMQSLWGFFAERFTSNRPLIVSGFDIRHTQKAANDVPNQLERIIKQCDIKISAEFKQFQEILLELLTKEYKHAVSAFERQKFFLYLKELQTSLEKNLNGTAELELWLQELKNLEYTARNSWGFEYRDVGMAKNILWLLNKCYPDEKIIVWAHNYHIAKDSQEVSANSESYRKNNELFPDVLMGDVLKQSIGDELFSIGLISGGGMYNSKAYQANYNEFTNITSSAHSLTSHLNKIEGDVLFLDLNKQEGEFSISGLEHNNELCLRWSKVFDSLIYYATSSGIKT